MPHSTRPPYRSVNCKYHRDPHLTTFHSVQSDRWMSMYSIPIINSSFTLWSYFVWKCIQMCHRYFWWGKKSSQILFKCKSWWGSFKIVSMLLCKNHTHCEVAGYVRISKSAGLWWKIDGAMTKKWSDRYDFSMKNDCHKSKWSAMTSIACM